MNYYSVYYSVAMYLLFFNFFHVCGTRYTSARIPYNFNGYSLYRSITESKLLPTLFPRVKCHQFLVKSLSIRKVDSPASISISRLVTSPLFLQLLLPDEPAPYDAFFFIFDKTDFILTSLSMSMSSCVGCLKTLFRRSCSQSLSSI